MSDWENKVRDAAAQAEGEVQRLIRYMNDEVIPDVRKQSSTALRTAAEQLQKLAEKMDDRK
jgi:hypothetical protein